MTPPSVAEFPDWRSLVLFDASKLGLFTGAAASATTDGVRQGPSANKNVMAYTPPAPLDLRNRCLALTAQWFAADQMKYLVSHTSGAVAFDGSPGGKDVTIDVDPGFTTPGSIAFGDGLGMGFFPSRVGNTLKGVRLATSYDANGKPILAASGNIPSGTRVTQHASSEAFGADLTWFLAASPAAYAAGNYVTFERGGSNYSDWVIDTWPGYGSDGWEGTVVGTGCDPASVGFIRVQIMVKAAPFGGVGSTYDGKQPDDPDPHVTWHELASFQRVPWRTASFTFDDAFPSDYDTVYREFSKPRPGFPNGMPATFAVINRNMRDDGREWQYQEMSASGFELCVHSHEGGAHGDGTNTMFNENPKIGAYGPHRHYETQFPGGAQADMAASVAFHKNAIGIPGGPVSYAWPHGKGAGRILDDWCKSHGLVCGRSLGTGRRCITNPPGNRYSAPGSGMERDNNPGDYQGHKLAMATMLEVWAKDCGTAWTTHSVGSGSNATNSGGALNQQQFAEILDFISDVKTGTNAHGNNPGLVHYPDLDVVTLGHRYTGRPVNRATPQVVGMAA